MLLKALGIGGRRQPDPKWRRRREKLEQGIDWWAKNRPSWPKMFMFAGAIILICFCAWLFVAASFLAPTPHLLR